MRCRSALSTPTTWRSRPSLTASMMPSIACSRSLRYINFTTVNRGHETVNRHVNIKFCGVNFIDDDPYHIYTFKFHVFMLTLLILSRQQDTYNTTCTCTYYH